MLVHWRTEHGREKLVESHKCGLQKIDPVICGHEVFNAGEGTFLRPMVGALASHFLSLPYSRLEFR